MNLLEKTIHDKLYTENIFNFINIDISSLNPYKQFIFFKQFVKNKIRYRVIRLEALMIFLTLHQEKYGNKKNLNIFFLDSTDDYDLSSIPFEIRNMVNYSYLLSIFKNIKIPFPYVFLNPSVYLPRKSYPFFIDIINKLFPLCIPGLFYNKSNFLVIISLYCCFISWGKKEISINSSHLSVTFMNLENRLSMIFFSKLQPFIATSKSERLILRLLPFSVKANSSVSSGMRSAVESMSYRGGIE